MKLKVKADPETNAFNITLNFINEKVIVFDVDPDQQAEFELEVAVQTQNLTAIEVNGVNQTIIFINSVTNKVILDDLITEFKIFLPQNENTIFATHGRTLEGDFINNFTKVQREQILGWVEHFDVPQSVQDQIFNSTVIDGQKSYEIAGKMKVGDFGAQQGIIDAGTAYFDGINNATNFQELFDKLEESVSLATGRNDTGNVPNAGKEPPS